ncbi:MAG: SwmB domain-containing protein [Chloroflexota bacterium]|nr:SwmB domain-containing protein [Chloroflexota bacterium]
MRSRPARSRRTAALWLVLAALALLCGSALPAGAESEAETAPPAKPTGLTVSSQPGSLEVGLDWDDVEGAGSYLLRWRLGAKGEKLNDGVSVESSDAAITVADYGTWVVRVQACNDHGCGKPQAKQFEVEPAPDPTPDPTPEPTPEQPNRAPEIDENAARYSSFTETGNAPRGTLVHRFFDGIFSDPDGDDLTFSAAITAGRAELVDAVNVASDRSLLFLRVDGDDDWTALSPVPPNPLVTTVTLTATDPDGLTASLTTTWHTAWDAPDPEPVSAPEFEPAKALQPEQPNRAPEIDVNAARYAPFTETGNAPRGTLVSRNFDGIFSDPDGDDLTFTAAITAGRAELVDAVNVASDRSLLFVRVDGDDDWAALSPLPPNPLVTTVTLTATDPDGLSASLSATWHTAWDAPDPEPVSDPEDEPSKALKEAAPLSVSVTASAQELLVGQPVSLSANIANAPEEGDPSYSWELEFGGSWFAWGSNATFSYTTNVAESQSFRVTVSYGSGESATSATSDPLAVTWVEEPPNRAPVVNENAAAYDAFVKAGSAPRGTLVTKSFAGIFSDPDGDVLNYATALSGDGSQLAQAVQTSADKELVGLRMESDSDWGAITPALPDPLVTTVTLLASDPDGLSSASVTGSWQTDWDSHPRIVSAEAHLSDGSLLLAFNQDVQASPAPTAGQFTVHVVNPDGTTGSNAVEGVSVLGNLVFLDLADDPEEGQTITLDYAHADATPLKRAAAGGDNAPSFSGQPVEVVEGLLTAAQQQEATTFVSNTGQTPRPGTFFGGISSTLNYRHAQGFTTGDHTAGYTLSEVGVVIGQVDGGGQLQLSIYTSVSDNPGSSLYTLANPASITNGAVNTFTAPADATLDANTQYFLVMETNTGSFRLAQTRSTGEDDGAASGWSIKDNRGIEWGEGWSTRPDLPRFVIKGSLGAGGPRPVRAVTTVDRAKVVITFNEPLSTTSTPAHGDFTVTVNGARRNVSSGGVAVSGSTVTLTLESAVASTDLVTVSYTKPATNPLQGSDNDDADSFDDRAVDITLVSNLGQADGDTGGTGADHAQGFVTGGNPGGYKLTALDIDFATLAADQGISVSIRSDVSFTSDGTLVGTLTNPGTLAAGVNTFTASGDGLSLEPSTGYVVVVDFPGSGASTLQNTASDSADTGAESGWNINDRSFFRDAGESPGFPHTHQQSKKLAVIGYGIADYDSDDDGLIEIRTAAQLNAIRWDTDGDGTPAAANQSDYAAAFPRAIANMGCPGTGCRGYEIGDGADDESAITINLGVAPYNTGAGWVPIPSFASVLEGNGHTIDGLFIRRTASLNGLFASIRGQVQNLKLTGVDVSSAGRGTASLAGENHGWIRAVSASGAVSGHLTLGACCYGGLVGSNDFNGRIVASHAAVSVTITGTAGGFNRGGLVGWNFGRIVASYATGSVTGGGNSQNIGGLAGTNGREGSIIASYSTGAVTGPNNLGGLVGFNQGAVTNSYYDSATSGQSDTGKGEGKTTTELQSPIGYTGIYANWNFDIDGVLGPNDHWDFGTASEYPTLDFKYTLPAGGLADYDTDDDGLIEVMSAAQLNALRWDADGDGAPDQANVTDYLAAYPNAPTRMGCPAAGCTGYEIGTGAAGEAAVTIDLDVAPHNAGAGWVPLPAYSATFEGNGNTIDGLTINRTVARSGLFNEVAASGRVRNLRLTGVDITANFEVGAVAGMNRGRITAVYATGGITRRGDALPQHPGEIGGLVGINETTGIIEASGSNVAVNTSVSVVNEFSDSVGGLVGRNGGAVRASYAFGDVTAGTGAIRVGAFVGRNWQAGSSVTASYATGRVRVADATPHAQVSAFIGLNEGASNHNYFDSVTARAATATGAAAKTPAELIAPTGYTGIYQNWNLDLNGDSVADDPWHFGADDDYPVIDHGGLSPADQPQPPVRVIALAVSSAVGPHDYYTEGEVIRVQVTFRKAVNVDTMVGRPRLKLKFKAADTTDHWAVYESGGGSKTLTFAYTVLAADSSGADSGVAVIADSLENNNGSIDDAVGNAHLRDLSHPGLAHDTAHKVDGSRDITPPTLSSAETNDNGSEIIVTFNEALKGHANTLDFRYTVDGGAQRAPGALATVLATGTVTLRGIVPAIEHGQTVKVKYIRPTGANVLRDTSDNAIESFDFQAVENKVPDTTPPAFVGAALNQAGDKITITFNEDLDDTSTPAPGDFTVTVNGAVRTGAVSGVEIDGATVVLTLTPALAATDEVQVGYTPGANRLRDASPQQNSVTSLASQQVAKAQPVVTAIELLNTPADGQTFKLGEVIKVRVTFSEPVTATGQPQLTLFSDDGWMRVQARGVVRGPGPYTTMEFRRGVQAGDQAIDKLVFGTHAKHGGGISMVGGGALTSASDLAISPSVDPVTFSYRADGGPAPRDAYEGYESYGPCRRDIGLGPWQYNYHGSLGTKWGVGCEARYEAGRYSKYFTFTIGAETRVRLHAESSTAFPKLILREGRSYGGAAIVEDEGFGSLHWARIDRLLPAGTYTLEATTPSGRSVSYFHLFFGIPRDLPDDDDPCVMMIDRGQTEAGQWTGLCHSTETLGAYAQYYRYTPSAPGLIELFLTSRGAAEALYLYEGDTLIKQNSSLNWKRNGVYAWIHYSGAKAGVTYTIEATAGETANYLLALRGANYWLWDDSDFKPEGAPVVTPQGHTCVEDLGTKSGGDLRGSGIWGWPCHSVEEPGGYARYYTFTLDEPKTVVVEVGSPHTWDAVLYLRAGNKGSGNHLAYSDNGHGVRAVDARLEVELEAGTYTIEAAVDVPGNGDGGHFVLYVKEPPPAPRAPTLVGNLGQSEGSPSGAYRFDHAQTFTTGNHGKGYRLAAVQVRLGLSGGDTPNYEVEIWTAGSDGSPHEKLATLAKPPNLQTGVNTFTSAEGIDLRPSTRYSIVFNLGWGGTNWEIRNTASGAEDQGALAGWSIDDDSWYRNSWSSGSWTAFDLSRKVAFLGSEIP